MPRARIGLARYALALIRSFVALKMGSFPGQGLTDRRGPRLSRSPVSTFPVPLDGVPLGTLLRPCSFLGGTFSEESVMGRAILLWLLGVPIPIIILLALLWH